MSSDIANGMGLVISNWGGDATWLWGDKCYGSCNWPQLTISNIKVTTGNVQPGPGPKPDPYNPGDYTFGDACSGIFDQCAEIGCPSVDHCRWSWPNGKSWDDPEAGCRCDIVP